MSKPTPNQLEAARLHATVWEHAANEMSRRINDNSHHVKQIMGVTIEQLKAQMWLAHYVAAGYRRVAAVDNLEE